MKTLSETEIVAIVHNLEKLRNYDLVVNTLPIPISDLGDPLDITPFLREHQEQLGILVLDGNIWFTSY